MLSAQRALIRALGASLIVLTPPWRKTAKMLPIENTRSSHYNFAHIAMPILSLGNPKKLYKDLSKGAGLKYLVLIWEGLESRMNVKYPHDGLNLSKEASGDELEAFIIRMPRPKSVPEAFFLGVVFGVKKSFLKKEVTSVRYFTLELGESPIDASTQYHFCEWSGRVVSPDHHNYGQLESADSSLFVEAIRQTTST
ncbi:MAG: hypothetical protein QOG71_3144 [Pyrinomonadaceae bacterium]|nr:hypothetical protein [Pyrinomonadaceae bacterium]